MIHINFYYTVSKKKLAALSKKNRNIGALNQNLLDDDIESEVIPFYYEYSTRRFGTTRLVVELKETNRAKYSNKDNEITKVNVKIPITFTVLVSIFALSILATVFYIVLSPISIILPLTMGLIYIGLTTLHLTNQIKKQLNKKLR